MKSIKFKILSPISGTETEGKLDLTISRSTGLSSIKTILPKPIFISAAIFSIFIYLGSQLALKDVKSSYFKILSECVKPSLAVM